MTSLSIIIPAYNEEKRIGPTLEAILEFAEDREADTEVIVIDDGSTDDTVGVCRSIGGTAVRLISTPTNMGKGHAVRSGMLTANGKYRLFTDADGSTPITEYPALEEALDRMGGSGVAFGSIGAPGAKIEQAQSGLRPAVGKLGNLLIRALVLPGVRDSQRGFKLFSADAAEVVFGRSVVNGWGFDVEALALARRLGYSCVEIPVTWEHVDGGTLTPTAYVTTLGDVVRVRWRLLFGSYDLSSAATESVT